MRTNWFKPKKYTHLTPKLSHKDYFYVHSKVSDPSKVVKHGFFPLIHRTISERRYKKFYSENRKGYYRSHRNKKEAKSTIKNREIYYATHIDALIYSYYCNGPGMLNCLYECSIKKENGLSKCIAAYRKIPISPKSEKGKCNIHFAKDAITFIRNQHECVAISMDIERFFDSIDHNILKNAWSRLLKKERLPRDHFNIYKSLTNFRFIEEVDLLNEVGLIGIQNQRKIREELNKMGSYSQSIKDLKERFLGKKNKKGKSLVKKHPFYNAQEKRVGIPQGTPISAFLSNLYLLEFDKFIYNEIKQINGFYIRYSDDILIICNPIYQKYLTKLIVEQLEGKFRLKINKDKTITSHFKKRKNSFRLRSGKNLRYLGFEFDGKSIRIKNSGTLPDGYAEKLKELIFEPSPKGYY